MLNSSSEGFWTVFIQQKLNTYSVWDTSLKAMDIAGNEEAINLCLHSSRGWGLISW